MKIRHYLLAGIFFFTLESAAADFDFGNPDQLIEASHAAIRQDAYLQAVNILEQALLAHPLHADLHHHLGLAYYKSGNYERAIERLQQALELAPENADSHYALGVVHLARAGEVSVLKVRGVMKNAIRHFERAIELQEEHASAHYYLIQILLRAPTIVGGDKARAMELNERLQTLSPLYHQVVNSNLDTMAGDYQTAEQLLLKAQRDAPDNTLLNHSLLAHYHQREQCENAVGFGQRFLSAAKEWDDSSPVGAYLLMAECHQRMGNRQQSLQHYALALSYNKSEKVVRQVQAAVRDIEEIAD